MSEAQVEIVIGLLVVAIPLVAMARRADVPYPITLVLGGLALGFIPGLPDVRLDPALVLLFFLPPLLYWEAITAPTDVMLANLSQIGNLAVVLVVVTTLAVAAIAHAVIPGMSWPIALVLGAVVAPTDELASAPVLERFHIPRHVIAIVEGESLVNDAFSLVIYAAALTAAVSGTFDPGRTALYLIAAPVGSIVVGLIVGRVAVEGWRRIRDTELQSVISLLVPFASYLPALRVGASGVLGVVTTGVFVNRFTPIVLTPESRLRLIGFWQTFVFVANALLFLLVGLQLHDIAANVFKNNSWQSVLWATLATNAAVILVRFGWILLSEYLPYVGASSEHSEPDVKHAIIVAWSGLRGAVSLAAALAIPLTVAGGAPFPHRDLIIFLTFSVILVTLVGGGLTLPAATARLDVSDAGREESADLQRALAGVTKAALEHIETLEREGRIDPEHAQALRARYAKLPDEGQEPSDPAARETVRRRSTAEREVIEAERRALIALRERGEIDNTVLRRVTLALDLAHSRIRN
ncbi:MAG: Na+/H+ antiporter [Candidatus Eremiobacteraeota bacterium]|nr:Na+/H+ antiporter [Candidatus Eremiobacteraeota bacterium]